MERAGRLSLPVGLTNNSDTIFALSSAPGRAGIAVLRVSGPAVAAAIEALTGQASPPPRQACLRAFRSPSGAVIDRGLLLWFPGPKSFTGEDLAELQVHGGRAVVQGLLDALAAQQGCRIALAGEFTRRAFEAGKLDLAEVEGLADLIAAETEAQRSQALRQADGSLSRQVDLWAQSLTRALAHVEAEIEFPDEAIGEDIDPQIKNNVAEVERDIEAALADRGVGERLREGFSAVLLGAPNVGKSSLMNRLAARDVAIVSEEAGTTRDVIEVSFDLGGYPLTLADTAGLRSAAEAESVGAVEREGMRRSLSRSESADITIEVRDATEDMEAVQTAIGGGDSSRLIVLNKSDLLSTESACLCDAGDLIAVSAKTGAGLDRLVDALKERLRDLSDRGQSSPLITRARHRQALDDCRAALARGQGAGSPELLAEDLRLALRALGRIVGRVDVEDVLDVVFRDFCIGK